MVISAVGSSASESLGFGPRSERVVTWMEAIVLSQESEVRPLTGRQVLLRASDEGVG